MDREVVWAVSASDDLVSIAEYIARDSEFYAAAMVRELIGANETEAMLGTQYRDPHGEQIGQEPHG